jgi:hypothetical protein
MSKPLQVPMFSPQTEWVPPLNLPDLKEHKEIAIDLETTRSESNNHGFRFGKKRR